MCVRTSLKSILVVLAVAVVVVAAGFREITEIWLFCTLFVLHALAIRAAVRVFALLCLLLLIAAVT